MFESTVNKFRLRFKLFSGFPRGGANEDLIQNIQVLGSQQTQNPKLIAVQISAANNFFAYGQYKAAINAYDTLKARTCLNCILSV